MTNTADATLTDFSCGPDCVIIDGFCRCWYGQAVSADFDEEWMNNIEPPF